MKKLNSFEDLSPLKRQITGGKRQRIKAAKAVKMTQEEIDSYVPIDTLLMRYARQMDKECPEFETVYEYKLFGEWTPCKESDLDRVRKSGFEIREKQVLHSKVKEFKAKYHIKRW